MFSFLSSALGCNNYIPTRHLTADVKPIIVILFFVDFEHCCR